MTNANRCYMDYMDIILHQSNNKSSIIKKIVNSNMELFSLRYSVGVKRRRRDLLFFTVSL